jgi:hypothetical protein
MLGKILDVDPQTLGEWGLAIITVLGGAAALLTVGAALREWYRRTLGRRRDRYERLGRLGTQAQLSFFESVLGEPPAMRKTITAEVQEYEAEAAEMLSVEREFIECFFIDRDYYVQVVCDIEETVIAFSVTTRSNRFRPTFKVPTGYGRRRRRRRRWKKQTGESFRTYFEVTLGKTRFERLRNDVGPPRRKIEVGARTYFFTELYGFGNPGHYQTFCFTASVAAVQAPIGPIADLAQSIGRGWVEEPSDSEGADLLRRVRHETPITTYTVLGPMVSAENYPSTFGPHGDEVRTLP